MQIISRISYLRDCPNLEILSDREEFTLKVIKLKGNYFICLNRTLTNFLKRLRKFCMTEASQNVCHIVNMSDIKSFMSYI